MQRRRRQRLGETAVPEAEVAGKCNGTTT